MARPCFPVGLLLLGALWAQGVGAGAAQGKADATAAQPSASAPVPDSLNSRALGIAEALLEYCAKNDPVGAAKVRERLKQLVQGASKERLAEARRSSEYQSAHDAEVDFIGKVELRNAHRLCSEGATRSR